MTKVPSEVIMNFGNLRVMLLATGSCQVSDTFRKIPRVSAEINIPQFWQHLTDEVEIAEVKGRTVDECLRELVKRFPRIEALLFSQKGKLLDYVGIYVNGESAYPEELTRPVVDGDKLYIINIIVGG